MIKPGSGKISKFTATTASSRTTPTMMGDTYNLLLAFSNPAFSSLLSAEFGPSLKITEVRTLRDLYNRTEESSPDLAVISARFASLPEFGVVATLFLTLDIPWLVVSDIPDLSHLASTLPPGAAGLLTVDGPQGIFTLSREIRRLLSLSSVVPVPARHHLTPRNGTGPGKAPAKKLVLIGSSTGGVEALLTILRKFPADCPPTAIVQHTGRSFGASLTRLLDRNCAAAVVPAIKRVALRPGRVVLAAGTGRHLEIDHKNGLFAQLAGTEPIGGHCPSVDALFSSAVGYAPHSVGVLLTGMGSDGANGLLALKRAGAITLGQDQSSSVVYGMPKVAFQRGAVSRQVSISDLAREILREANSAIHVRDGIR